MEGKTNHILARRSVARVICHVMVLMEMRGNLSTILIDSTLMFLTWAGITVAGEPNMPPKGWQMNLTIRHALEKDLDVVSKNVMAMAHDALDIELSSDVVTKAVHSLFEHPELGFYLVGEMGGLVVGSLLVTFEWSDWRNGVYWWIQSVYVRPDYRKKGIYRQLHRFIEQKAAADPGVVGLNLYVYKENIIARSAYESLGMVQSNSLIYYTPDLKVKKS